MMLKTFDVGFSIRMWHFVAVFTVFFFFKPNPNCFAYISVFGVTMQRKKNIHRLCRTLSMNVDWLVQRSHLSLILQNSVHPSERELVITGPQGAITEYCFREWLTPSCFVFAGRETSEADRRDSVEGWLRMSCSWGFHLSCKLHYIKAPFSIYFYSLSPAHEDGLLLAYNRSMMSTRPPPTYTLFASLPTWGLSCDC